MPDDVGRQRRAEDRVRTAARDVENSIHAGASEFEKQWSEVTTTTPESLAEPPAAYPEYRHPRKKWRIKQGATPSWYKAKGFSRSRATEALSTCSASS